MFDPRYKNCYLTHEPQIPCTVIEHQGYHNPVRAAMYEPPCIPPPCVPQPPCDPCASNNGANGGNTTPQTIYINFANNPGTITLPFPVTTLTIVNGDL